LLFIQNSAIKILSRHKILLEFQNFPKIQMPQKCEIKIYLKNPVMGRYLKYFLLSAPHFYVLIIIKN